MGKLGRQSSLERSRDRESRTSDLTLKCGLVNTNSLHNKLSFIYHLANTHALKVIGVTETWLTSEDPTSFVSIPGFELFRGDVNGTVKKHGAGMYVSKDISVIQIEVPVPNAVAVKCIDLDLLIVTIYRPPSYSVEENAALLTFLDSLYGGMEVVVMGDFNLPSLSWPLEEADSDSIRAVDRQFRDCFVGLGWTQWVEFGTFHRSDNILDLVFTSDEDRIVDISSDSLMPRCGHFPIIFSLAYQGTDSSEEAMPKLDWHKGNYLKISED